MDHRLAQVLGGRGPRGGALADVVGGPEVVQRGRVLDRQVGDDLVERFGGIAPVLHDRGDQGVRPGDRRLRGVHELFLHRGPLRRVLGACGGGERLDVELTDAAFPFGQLSLGLAATVLAHRAVVFRPESVTQPAPAVDGQQSDQ